MFGPSPSRKHFNMFWITQIDQSIFELYETSNLCVAWKTDGKQWWWWRKHVKNFGGSPSPSWCPWTFYNAFWRCLNRQNQSWPFRVVWAQRKRWSVHPWVSRSGTSYKLALLQPLSFATVLRLYHRRVICTSPDMLCSKHFCSPSPTVLELQVEICSSGCPTITIRCLIKRNAFGCLLNETVGSLQPAANQ